MKVRMFDIISSYKKFQRVKKNHNKSIMTKERVCSTHSIPQFLVKQSSICDNIQYEKSYTSILTFCRRHQFHCNIKIPNSASMSTIINASLVLTILIIQYMPFSLVKSPYKRQNPTWPTLFILFHP